MKAQTISLIDNRNLDKFIDICHEKMRDKKNKLEAVLRNRTESATLAQFKAIFGVWFDYLQMTHNRSVDYFHFELKLKFLVRIYENHPIGEYQEMWVENIILWTERGDINKALQARNRISLAWATKEQMCMYMRDIELYFIEIGEPLPVIENNDYRKTYQNFCKRLGI